MIGITALQSRYTPFSPNSSEEFSSASRSVKPGLIAAGIVSAWTWAATLVSLTFVLFGVSRRLTSAEVTASKQRCSLQVWYVNVVCNPTFLIIYSGVSGPWWYGGKILTRCLVLLLNRMSLKLGQLSRSYSLPWCMRISFSCIVYRLTPI
jgi:hypothetical protein